MIVKNIGQNKMRHFIRILLLNTTQDLICIGKIKKDSYNESVSKALTRN